jgi:hypothetical protein
MARSEDGNVFEILAYLAYAAEVMKNSATIRISTIYSRRRLKNAEWKSMNC